MNSVNSFIAVSQAHCSCSAVATDRLLLLAPFHLKKADRKRYSAVGYATQRKLYKRLIGRPKTVFCLYAEPVYLQYRLQSFEGFVVSKVRPEFVSVTRGRDRPEVTSTFDFSIHFLFKWSVNIFVYVYPFKTCSTFSFWLEIVLGAEILGF
jgi:hypothetical protein